MGRPRTPTKILELRGGLRNRPSRAAGRAQEPKPEPGLGEPPDYFNEEERARWRELKGVVPAGVLTKMDRPGAELLCRLWATLRYGTGSIDRLRLLASLLGKFGLTPSERSKLSGAPQRDPSRNPFEGLSK